MIRLWCGCDVPDDTARDKDNRIFCPTHRIMRPIAEISPAKKTRPTDWISSSDCNCSWCRPPIDAEVTPLDEALIDTQRLAADLVAQVQTLATQVEALQAKQSDGRLSAAHARLTLDRVATVLAAFYRAPLTISSVQPLLALAEELNPTLKESR